MKNKTEILAKIKALELLNKEMPMKYPKGSHIVFSAIKPRETETFDKSALFNCKWYDKKGESFPISNPTEWQGITYDEVEKICAMFDDTLIVSRSIIHGIDYGEEKFGINVMPFKGSNQ